MQFAVCDAVCDAENNLGYQVVSMLSLHVMTG